MKGYVTIYGDKIEGLSLRFRLWMLWKGVSKRELLDRYWERWDTNFWNQIEVAKLILKDRSVNPL